MKDRSSKDRTMKLSTSIVLPQDKESATLVGRAWLPGQPGGPSPVALREGSLYDLSAVAATCSALLNVANPVRLVRDAIARGWAKPVGLPLRADFDWPRPDSRREFLRARLVVDAEGRSAVQIYPNQDSGVLTSTVWADGFVEVAENETVQRGDTVSYLPFSQLLS